ncbi:MAG: hypothetical protein V1676_06270 [Candidatus Diapherotrites archaeon]
MLEMANMRKRGELMEGNANDKLKITAGVVAVVLVIAGIGAYAASAEPIEMPEVMLIALVLFLVAGSLFVFWPRFKAIRAGLPAEDERLKRVNHKAGYYAFIAAIWGSVALMWADSAPGETLLARHALEGVIILTGFVFMVSYLLLSRKGNVD